MSRASRVPVTVVAALAMVGIFAAVAPPASAHDESVRATLRVKGVATKGNTDQGVPFSGTLRCRADGNRGTGTFEDRADRTCDRLAETPRVFSRIGDQNDRACAEVYGGPQTVTIRGKVDGRRVRVKLDRSDGCGIGDWDTIEWLIGSPER